MTPRVTHPGRVPWPCRVDPALLKEMVELAEEEVGRYPERYGPRVGSLNSALGLFLERECRQIVKRYRRNRP